MLDDTSHTPHTSLVFGHTRLVRSAVSWIDVEYRSEVTEIANSSEIIKRVVHIDTHKGKLFGT
jgi:hypothetical protein